MSFMRSADCTHSADCIGCTRSADPRGYLLYMGFERNFNTQLRTFAENVALANPEQVGQA